MQRHGIVVQAYSPLGSTGSPLRENEIVRPLLPCLPIFLIFTLFPAQVTSIAKKHDVDPATVLLSWLISRNVSVQLNFFDSCDAHTGYFADRGAAEIRHSFPYCLEPEARRA